VGTTVTDFGRAARRGTKHCFCRAKEQKFKNEHSGHRMCQRKIHNGAVYTTVILKETK
jgi:hypothetical protein